MNFQPMSKEETSIREILEGRSRAFHERNTDAIVALYSKDVEAFDLNPPLRLTAREVLDRNALDAWFDLWRGPVNWEISDLVVSVGGFTAFSHSLNRISGLRAEGYEVSTWVRQTVCFRKLGDAWKIVHQHTSVPFHGDGSNRAALDLMP